MKAGLFAAAAILALCVSVPAIAGAADSYFDLPPEELLNARVTSASRRAESLFESPNAVYVITHDDIERAGVTTIPDALRMAPGVNVAQLDGNSWAVNIRGLNGLVSNKLLVLIDGRTVYNPAFAGVFWETVDLPLDDIEHIEVVRGPGGTVWGANAVNGVINIITRNAADTQGTAVQAMAGNRERGIENLRQGGQLPDNGFYRVYARAMDQSESPAPGGGDANDEWKRLRTGFRADWDGMTVQGDAYRINTDQFSFVPNFTGPAFGTVFSTQFHYEGANILGRWERDLSGGQLMLQSYLDYVGRSGGATISDRHLTYDLEAVYNLNARGRHEWTTGAGYRLVTSNETNIPGSVVSPDSRIDHLFSLFAQDKIRFFDTLSLTLGTKVEHNDYSGLEVQPNAKLQWLPSEEQTVWAAVSRAVRTPTQIEQNVSTVAGNGAGTQNGLVPNPGFDSETLIAYELGYRRRITPNLSVDTTAFIHDYDNLAVVNSGTPFIVNNGVDPPFLFTPFFFANGGAAQTGGIEVAAEWQPRSDLSFNASYSYLDVQMHANTNVPGQEALTEGQTPHHQLSLRTHWQATDQLSLDGTVHHVSDLAANAVLDYTRLDLNLGYQLSDGVKFNLVGQNLLDDQHREFGSAAGLNAAEVPRSVFGRVTCKF
ncbi:MAG TPA: TonB-dependent receptor [Patescibacteria group bacterium]|nr:TonB-dependent receptor [Patescibacteria group bacterium]